MRLIQRRIGKLEEKVTISQSHSHVLVEIMERRHRRLVAAGIEDEPVEVQLRKIRDRSRAVCASLPGASLGELVLAARKMRQQGNVA